MTWAQTFDQNMTLKLNIDFDILKCILQSSPVMSSCISFWITCHRHQPLAGKRCQDGAVETLHSELHFVFELYKCHMWTHYTCNCSLWGTKHAFG